MTTTSPLDVLVLIPEFDEASIGVDRWYEHDTFWVGGSAMRSDDEAIDRRTARGATSGRRRKDSAQVDAVPARAALVDLDDAVSKTQPHLYCSLGRSPGLAEPDGPRAGVSSKLLICKQGRSGI